MERVAKSWGVIQSVARQRHHLVNGISNAEAGVKQSESMSFWAALVIMAFFATSIHSTFAIDAAFLHPGLLSSHDDLARISAAVAAKQEPIYSGFLKFRDHPASQAGYVMKGPKESVGRGAGWDGPGQGIYDADANAAFQCAMMWAITGEKPYAQKAIEILNAWSRTLKEIGGRDAVLGAGLGPFKMVNAAEIIRYTNAGWSDTDAARAEKCFKEAVYPVIRNFSPFANGNWDTAAVKTMLAIGVFCNDRAIYERALHYYVDGSGNGRLTYYIINADGECQESGRDSQHSQLGIAHLADAAQVAWNQGLDLYAYADNRLLKGFEYTARYNTGGDVPFQEWMDRTGDNHYTHLSPRGGLRAIYEEVFNHYANVKGLAAPYTQAAAEQLRPEGQGVTGNAGINGADHIGFGTLLFTQPRSTVPPAHKSVPVAPGALTAHVEQNEIQLRWIAPIGAIDYVVKRSADKSENPVVLDRGVTTNGYTDKDVKPGALYRYTVSASNQLGGSPDALAVSICAGLPPPWTQQDIGGPLLSGRTEFDGNAFTIEAGGTAIGGTADQFHLAAVPMTGAGSLMFRFVPQTNSQHSQFGIMMRESNAPDAAAVALLIERADDKSGHGWRVVLRTRPKTGVDMVESASRPLGDGIDTNGRLTNPCWLRLDRKEDAFTASYSVDGDHWQSVGSVDAPLHSTVSAGIAVCSKLVSHSVAATTVVQLDHLVAPNYPAAK
ncbi:MAG: alginate lyase family protein [Phycisphaerae bacterium]|nr:alginate lyase family protein [Phycisphaerae bacterium]